jgi:hypothetical protein
VVSYCVHDITTLEIHKSEVTWRRGEKITTTTSPGGQI